MGRGHLYARWMSGGARTSSSPFLVPGARLTDVRTYVAWGVHGRKPARTTTFAGRDDPLDSILLHGLCARRPSVLGSRQFGGDQFDRHGELRFDAFLVTLTDSRIGVDDVCGVVWVSPPFFRAGKWAERYPRWTPEIFGTKVRGTACGIASALSRMYVLMRIDNPS